MTASGAITINSLELLRNAFAPAIRLLRKKFTPNLSCEEIEYLVLRFGKGLTRPYFSQPGHHEHFLGCLTITDVELPQYKCIHAFYFDVKFECAKISKTMSGIEAIGTQMAGKLLSDYRTNNRAGNKWTMQ